MDVEQHTHEIMQERTKAAANWFVRCQPLPPNVTRANFVLHYDDGYHLTLDASQEIQVKATTEAPSTALNFPDMGVLGVGWKIRWHLKQIWNLIRAKQRTANASPKA